MASYKLFNRIFLATFGINVMANSYFDAKNEIIRYQEGKIDAFDVKYHKLNTEVDAGWYGVVHGLPNNLLFSWCWPISLPLITMPYIAAKMNPKKVSDQEPMIIN